MMEKTQCELSFLFVNHLLDCRLNFENLIYIFFVDI